MKKPLIPKDFEEDESGENDECPCLDQYEQRQMVEQLKRSGELETNE